MWVCRVSSPGIGSLTYTLAIPLASLRIGEGIHRPTAAEAALAALAALAVAAAATAARKSSSSASAAAAVAAVAAAAAASPSPRVKLNTRRARWWPWTPGDKNADRGQTHHPPAVFSHNRWTVSSSGLQVSEASRLLCSSARAHSPSTNCKHNRTCPRTSCTPAEGRPGQHSRPTFWVPDYTRGNHSRGTRPRSTRRKFGCSGSGWHRRLKLRCAWLVLTPPCGST